MIIINISTLVIVAEETLIYSKFFILSSTAEARSAEGKREVSELLALPDDL